LKNVFERAVYFMLYLQFSTREYNEKNSSLKMI
jgi:hypothetical protein